MKHWIFASLVIVAAMINTGCDKNRPPRDPETSSGSPYTQDLDPKTRSVHSPAVKSDFNDSPGHSSTTTATKTPAAPTTPKTPPATPVPAPTAPDTPPPAEKAEPTPPPAEKAEPTPPPAEEKPTKKKISGLPADGVLGVNQPVTKPLMDGAVGTN